MCACEGGKRENQSRVSAFKTTRQSMVYCRSGNVHLYWERLVLLAAVVNVYLPQEVWTCLQATPRFYLAAVQDKIWEWPGDEASVDVRASLFIDHHHVSFFFSAC